MKMEEKINIQCGQEEEQQTVRGKKLYKCGKNENIRWNEVGFLSE